MPSHPPALLAMPPKPQPKPKPEPEPEPESDQAPAGRSCCAKCCAGLRTAGCVVLVAVIVQLGLRAAESAALDGLQCGARDLKHLSDVPFRGMHVLTAAAASDGSVCGDGDSEFDLQVFVDGAADCGLPGLSACPTGGQTAPTVRVPCASKQGDNALRDSVRGVVPAARAMLHNRLLGSGGFTDQALDWLAANGPERRADKDPWADAKFFTPYGTPVPEDELTEAFRQCRTVYVFEGGTFMWPGVSVGHSITVPIKPQYW